MPLIEVECVACDGGRRPMLYGEPNPTKRIAPCPYCNATGRRMEWAPHKTHEMTYWHSEIRCYSSTPRFYGVRTCAKCGAEEARHPAGHFAEKKDLDGPCTGKPTKAALRRKDEED